MMNKQYIFISIRIFLFSFLVIPLFSQSYAFAKEEKLSLEDITRIEYYLNNITTLTADFLQIAPSGEVSTGRFFLSRPGKLRWEYNPPVPILILVNGSLITYYDSELKQASYVSATSNLAAFLTKRNIQFSGDISITDTHKTAGIMRISIIQKEKKEEGELTLVYNSEPVQLKKIEVIDASGQLTTLTLSNIHYKEKLDNALFILQKPPLITGVK